MKRFATLCLLVAVITPASDLFAGDADWPQWRGPQRDGHAAPQELLESWPEQGPRLKWTFTQAGRGYSALAVVDDRIYTMGSDEENCYAYCIDFKSGKEMWKTAVGKASTSGEYNHGWGGGPRATPTVDGDQIFLTTDIGVVVALAKDSGEVQWSVDMVDVYGGKVPVWGYSESPLVDGDRVIVTPGGENFMVGLDRTSGDKVWASQGVNAPVQYVSPLKGTVGSTTFYVTASKPGLFAFDVTSGNEVFSDDTTGNDVAVIPTPVLVGDQLYHTSDYGAGNTLLKLSAGDDGKLKTESIYHLEGKTMRNHHGGVVLVDGVIYGFSKINRGVWMAQDLESGEVLWEQSVDKNKSGSICYADGKLYCYNDTDGSCYLVTPNRDGWKETGKVVLPKQTELERDKGAIWAHPVVANQTLFIRDQDLIFAFDIAK
ncbi:outer membrane protein assembly factor BamB family protein [Rubripirellula amarantea]|nr:PQQ-binding-like beta-propeller repeat protein [Rubripirellula amarantea]